MFKYTRSLYGCEHQPTSHSQPLNSKQERQKKLTLLSNKDGEGRTPHPSQGFLGGRTLDYMVHIENNKKYRKTTQLLRVHQKYLIPIIYRILGIVI